MKYIKIFSLAALMMAIVSCQGFKMQTDYKYESQPLDPHIGVDAWEYMQSREDLSEMVAAVEFTGMQDYYTQKEQTITFTPFAKSYHTVFDKHIIIYFQLNWLPHCQRQHRGQRKRQQLQQPPRKFSRLQHHAHQWRNSHYERLCHVQEDLFGRHTLLTGDNYEKDTISSGHHISTGRL